jgi:hypothetical protein
VRQRRQYRAEDDEDHYDKKPTEASLPPANRLKD